MADESLDLSGLIKLLRSRYKMILAIVGASMFLFMLATLVLPKKYKSTAALTIYTKYFQNPLVKDFLPEIYDNNELKSQRETLIRKAFTSEFLNELGDKHGLFKTKRGDPRHSLEEYDLLKRIEVFSIESTTFQVSYVGRTPLETFEILNTIVGRVAKTLADERRKTIAQLRDSIRKRIETMALTMDSAADPLASVRPELLQAELDRLNAQIKALRTQYTDRHPMVTRLVARVEVIKKWLKTTAAGGDNASPDQAPLVGGEPKDPSMQVYTDLLKKLNYLNIVLEMEEGVESAYVGVLQQPMLPSSPVFPRRSVFLFWGLLTGFMLSITILLLQEYIARSHANPEQFARQLGTQYLGPLPVIQWRPAGPPKTKSSERGTRLDEWQ
jgi:uncharacterized protein involved in exopolysaccharide biosynthesis